MLLKQALGNPKKSIDLSRVDHFVRNVACAVFMGITTAVHQAVLKVAWAVIEGFPLFPSHAH
jgi:hypothetical protein